MNRRHFVFRLFVGLVVATLTVLGLRRRKGASVTVRSPFDRVVFVCSNNRGEYSPGIYLHGPDGGGPACLSFVAAAAKGMRAGEPSDSAAGLCGYLFAELGTYVTSGGGLSLWNGPKPGESGTVDWQAYCPWNVDLILVNVDRRVAECYVSAGGAKDRSKSLVSRLDDLHFGG